MFRRTAPAILMAQGRDPTGWVRPERIVTDMELTQVTERNEAAEAEEIRTKLIDDITATFALLSPEGKRHYLRMLQSICEEEAAV